MFLIPTDQIEIQKTIDKLKNCAVGWDKIPAKIIKDNKVHIAQMLTHIINLSFEQGVFPK